MDMAYFFDIKTSLGKHINLDNKDMLTTLNDCNSISFGTVPNTILNRIKENKIEFLNNKVDIEVMAKIEMALELFCDSKQKSSHLYIVLTRADTLVEDIREKSIKTYQDEILPLLLEHNIQFDNACLPSFPLNIFCNKVSSFLKEKVQYTPACSKALREIKFANKDLSSNAAMMELCYKDTNVHKYFLDIKKELETLVDKYHKQKEKAKSSKMYKKLYEDHKSHLEAYTAAEKKYRGELDNFKASGKFWDYTWATDLKGHFYDDNDSNFFYKYVLGTPTIGLVGVIETVINAIKVPFKVVGKIGDVCNYVVS